MNLIILLVLTYLAGSIPTSILLGRLLKGVDVREHGSRNPGATNTFRVLGWKIGTVVGLIDIFKGFFAVWFLTRWVPDSGLVSPDIRLILAGVGAVLGHVFTIFAGFKGGKGVGTAFGVIIGLAPLPALIILVIWLVLLWRTGYVSVGSIGAAVALPISVIGLGIARDNLSIPIAVLCCVLAVLVVYRHRGNIVRLRNGTENRFNTRRFA